jgi:hypothetical protein
MFSWLRDWVQKSIVRMVVPIYETIRLVIFVYKKPPYRSQRPGPKCH